MEIRSALLLACLGVTGAQCEPLQYRFEGVVSQLSRGARLDNTDIRNWDSFGMTLELDFSRPGTITHTNLVVETVASLAGPEYADAIHVSFIEGNRLQYRAGESSPMPYREWAVNYGVALEPAPGVYNGYLFTAGPNWRVLVQREVDPKVGILGWRVGDEFFIESELEEIGGSASFVVFGKLVSITAVPEPGSLALAAFGAVAVAWGRVYRRKST